MIGAGKIGGVFCSTMLSTRKYLVRLQVVLWAFSALLFYMKFKALPFYPAVYILAITVTSFSIFAAIVYGYMFLYNRFYQTKGLLSFILVVFLFFWALVFSKIFIENRFVSQLTSVHFRLFYSDQVLVSKVHFANAFSNCFFALITGILFKSFTESLALRERQAEIQKKHLETELNQLKAQVQPHFLFNSLNNLYYDTYKTLPAVAERIAMLSDIMRYFMEESPKELVPIATEVDFVEDFIRLEGVRFPYPIDVQIEKEVNPELMVPPMLLIPLVENTFKHGVKNDGEATSIEIRLRHHNNRLSFTTKNKIYSKKEMRREGVGLKNLRDRLTLLYGKNYVLKTQEEDGYFLAELTIPAHEN